VLVRVGGTSLNRKDLFALADLRGPGIRPRPPLPHVNGTDAWGTVAATGEGTGTWRPGDRVVIYPGLFCGACAFCVQGETSACVTYGVLGEQRWGAHAEFVAAPARNLERIPDRLHPDARACIGGSWLTAWRALVTVAVVRPGETVLVVGAAGGVGTAAIRIARAAGCRTLAVVGSDWKAGRAREIGADETLEYGDGMPTRVAALTDGRGVDVAIDSVGGAGWRNTIAALAPFGRMAICGATAGDAPSISIREIYQAHRRILGAPLGTRTEFTALVRAFAAGRLEPVVAATVPLERIHEGLRLLETREFFGKVAVSVGEA
jgi:NADPH:quinone reductase-like Zn-dependent oxidoreductase